MNVNRNGNSGIDLTLTDDEASALVSVLGGVADNTNAGAVEALFNRLLDLHVTPEYVVTVEDNVAYDADEHEFDPFTHNFVLSEPQA